MSRMRVRLVMLLLLVPTLVSAQPPPTTDDPPPDPEQPERAPPAPQEPPRAVEPPKPVDTPPDKAEKQDKKSDEKPWYERFAIRGYLQTRFRAYSTDENFKNDLGDRAIAKNNTFSIRRARFVVSGDAAPFLSIYVQTELSGANLALRDYYGDFFLDKKKEFRLRIGQSKLPYGFENLQSSQNRAPLDRSDSLNTGVPGERELGVFAYWAPEKARKLFKHLTDSGLKGSGDYGVVGFGAYAGQLINQADKNENVHVVARVSVPLELGKQIIEIGGGGYIGKFNVTKDNDMSDENDYRDMRAFATFVLYPQPIGIQAEYTFGRGPEFDKATGVIRAKDLQGGYVMLTAKAGDFFPFARGTLYDGGIKNATDAPRSEVRELALGTEWHYKKRVELTAEVDIANRQLNDIGACENGDTDNKCVEAVFRLQAQLNY